MRIWGIGDCGCGNRCAGAKSHVRGDAGTGTHRFHFVGGRLDIEVSFFGGFFGALAIIISISIAVAVAGDGRYGSAGSGENWAEPLIHG